MKESEVKSMRIKVEGKNEVLNNLEKAERLIDQARDILYRTPTQIKVVVEECDEEEKITSGSSDDPDRLSGFNMKIDIF